MFNLLKGSKRGFDVEFTEWKLNFADELCREFEGTFWTLNISEEGDLFLMQVDAEDGLPVARNGRMKGFIRVLLNGKNPKETAPLWGQYNALQEESEDGKYIYRLEKVYDEAE